MSDVAIGYLGLGIMLILLFLRLPVGIAMLVTGIGGIGIIKGTAGMINFAGTAPLHTAASWTLSSLPLFLWMGYMASETGLVRGLFNAARLWLNRIPGALGIATMTAGAAFGSICGSTMASAAALARIAFPEMIKAGYDKRLAAGTIVGAGPIAQLIPPSIGMIIYGTFVNLSISDLFVAGVVPGLVTTIGQSTMIMTWVRVNPRLAPASNELVTWRQRFGSLPSTWPLPTTVIIVFGGLYYGVFTATEAGAIGAAVILLIGIASKNMKWSHFTKSVSMTATATANIFLLVVGAIVFSRFLVLSGATDAITQAVVGLNISLPAMVFLMFAIYLVMGMFVEALTMLLITLPIFIPILQVYHANLIWFGVLCVKFIELAVITPPVALLLYVVKGSVGDAVSWHELVSGAMRFLLSDIVLTAILIFFPILSTWLPGTMVK